MNPTLLEKARESIADNAVLINLVSRRVRQLNSGHRPLIDAEPSWGFIDIALKEIAQNKIHAVSGDSDAVL